MYNYSRNRTGSFPIKQSITHYPDHYKPTKEELDRQTSALLNERKNLQLKTPLNSQYNIDNRSHRQTSFKSYNSPKSQISERIQEIVKMCGDDKHQLKNQFQQMTDAEKKILDMLSQHRPQTHHVSNIVSSQARPIPGFDEEHPKKRPEDLTQRYYQLLDENKKLRAYIQHQAQNNRETKYLQQQIEMMQKKLNEYEAQIYRLKNSGQLNIDMRSLADQCQGLRQDTIHLLLKGSNQNNGYLHNEGSIDKANFLKDLERLRQRVNELQEENRMLKGQRNQRKSYNTYTTRFSPEYNP